MKKDINSKAYWNERFATGDWEEKGGNRQTRYFYELLVSLLPERIKEELRDVQKGYTVCDVGCAEGDGTALLAEQFPSAKLTGVDIADAAIERAKKRYPNLTFLTKLQQQYDVVVSSNVLEHFENPFTHMQELFTYSKRYVIVLVPFEEYERISEHFYTFLYRDFSLIYQDFTLVYFDVVRADKKIWNGKQILLIYQKDVDLKRITLEKLGIGQMIQKLEHEILYQKEMLAQKETLLTKNESTILFQNETLKQQEITIKKQEELINILQASLDQATNQLQSIYTSNMWKFAQRYYALKESAFMIPFVKVIRNLKRNGIKTTVQKMKLKLTTTINQRKYDKEHRKVLEEILKSYPEETIIILPMLVDWNIPLFQRPQHLALNLAKDGYLYFYCTGNMQYDAVNGFEEKAKRCYITNRFDLVDAIKDRKKIYDLSSTDNITDWEFVKKRLENGNGIVYQYIDEISDDLSGFKIPQKTWEKHYNILKDERCIVIPSATKLENDVKKYRSKNYKLVTNGVELVHFRQNVDYEAYPDTIKKVVDRNKPVIGYFGAFASWFDYELVVKLATQRKDLEIVLLGWDYDGTIKKYQLEEYENITVLGPIDYKELPKYASCFSVSTIPFVINEITESTSPIKLFEYMAMGKPIVTTAMPECRKYQSVLIGEDHDDFIAQIEKALKLHSDKNYLKLLHKEAEENSWDAKARDIAEMIEKTG